MELRRLELEKLLPHPRNPRRIDDDAFEGLKTSITTFGYVEPIVWNERTGRVVGGHQRLKALRDLGEREAEVVVVDLSETEELALNVTLNNRHVAGEWTTGLAPILDELKAVLGEGFTSLRFEQLNTDLAELEVDLDKPLLANISEDEVPELPDTPVTQPGDLWQLGSHRVLCGDSTNWTEVETLMQGTRASICFTDPPWNVAYGSSHNPKWKTRAITNDDLGKDFPAFCESFCANIKKATAPGAAVYMVMSAQEWPVIDSTLRESGFHWSSTIIWAKDSLVLSRKDYHTQYEPIWYGWNEAAARLYPLRDRQQSDLWSIARPRRSDDHPTTKPVALVARALLNSSRGKDIVFEPFAGSGSTLIACEQTNRTCYAIELEPRYVDVVCRRYYNLTGISPVRESDDVSFVDSRAEVQDG
jgi:DNA modification methylase